MKIRLTQTNVGTFKPKDKPYWITDEGCENLRLYVGARGRTWYVDYRDANDRKAHHKLGSADALTVAQAREMARDIAVKVSKGESVKKEKPAERLTLGAFLKDHYFPHILPEKKSAKEMIRALTVAFEAYFKTPADDITPLMINKWRESKRTGDGKLKAASVNRTTAYLKAALNYGVDNGLIEKNPIAKLKQLKERDSKLKNRYLKPDERERLEAALIERERRMRVSGRSQGGEYADYLRPAVLVSLNTGIRQGTLFSLLWGDVDFSAHTLSLRGEVSKNGETACIPLNDDAFDVLSSWRGQSDERGDGDFVFPSPKTGGKMQEVKTAWRALLASAGIEGFRWHDMRHDFASQLVMKGVDLNTVRELMCHKSMAMTIRYAHLAPENKLNAVQVLNRRTKGDKIIGRIREAR